MAKARGKNFTRWENNLQDNILAAGLPMYELLFVLRLGRLTYGWGTNWTKFNVNDYTDIIPRTKVYGTKRDLVEKGVIKPRYEGIGIERRGYKWKVEWKAEGYPKEVEPWVKEKCHPTVTNEDEMSPYSDTKKCHPTVTNEDDLSPYSDTKMSPYSDKNVTVQLQKCHPTVTLTGCVPAAAADLQEPKEKKDNKDKYKAPTKVGPGGFGSKDFWVFYNTYPRKINAKHAYSKWKEKVEDLGVLPEVVMKTLRKHLRGEFAGRPADKVPYPNSWLDREPWLDGAPGAEASGYELEVQIEIEKHQERRELGLRNGLESPEYYDKLHSENLEKIRRKYGKAKDE